MKTYTTFRAFIPKDPHDSWSSDHTTREYANLDDLMASLEPRKKLPGGLDGVRIFRREVTPWELVETFTAETA